MARESASPSLIGTVSSPPHEEAGLLGQLGLSPSLFGAQLVNFALVLFVVVRFIVRPLQAQLSERSERIERGLRQAQEADERLKKAVAEQTDVLARARKEAAEIVSSARALADQERQQGVERTKEEIVRLVAQGKAQLANDRQAMLAEAKQELARVVVLAAAKVTEGALNTQVAEAKAIEAIEQSYGKA